jgi:hypothetical protein
MRAQLVRILDSQGIPIPTPNIGSVQAIPVTLGFVDIAFDECRPKRMAGYGGLADTAAIQIAGLTNVISLPASSRRRRRFFFPIPTKGSAGSIQTASDVYFTAAVLAGF